MEKRAAIMRFKGRRSEDKLLNPAIAVWVRFDTR